MKKMLLLIIAVSLMTSCHFNTRVAGKFRDIEGYLAERPDSALTELEEIREKELSSQRNRAKYALLYSMALDKNYIDTADDSLINIAVGYYKDKGTSKDRMLAYYYLGRVYQNGGNYTQAIVAFTNALDNAECINDIFYKGLIYRGLADIYGLTFNDQEKLRYRQLEYDAFVEAGATRHTDFAIKQLASSYTEIHNFEKGGEYYNQAIEIAKEKRDTALLLESLLGYAHLLTLKDSPEPGQALSIYSYVADTLKRPMSLYDKITWATAYSKLGHNDLAQKTIDEIRPYIGEDKTLLAIVTLNEYNIAKDLGYYKDAVGFLYESIKIQDSLYYSALNNSITAAQRDYIKQQLEHEKYKARSSRTIAALIIISLLLMVSIIGYGFYRYIKKKNYEMSNGLSMLEDARRLLLQNEQKMSGFSQKIGQLYRTKLELIGGICEKFYEHENIGKRQTFVYREVESVIDKLSADNESPLLEAILNEYKDDIVSKLKNDSELKFKHNDYLLLEYWFVGFSPTVMSLLLGKEIDVIYNMRSRIRAKIRNSNSKYKDLYMQNMLND
ncbi:MAG: hypothetical protein OSJ55_01880 [Bacteroidales bacterium]|nr:hypothetical protein [Bacteroidales bacterium]